MSPSRLGPNQLAQLFVAQGGAPKYARLMANLAQRESGGRPTINNKGTNRNGTVDWGLWQVNDIWRKDPVVGPLFRSGAILTPEGNAQAAVHILKVQGPKAWATYQPGTDAKYLGGFQGATTSPSSSAQPAAPTQPATQPAAPAVDNSALRGQLVNQFLNQRGGDQLAFAMGIRSLRDVPGTTAAATAPPAPVRAVSQHSSAPALSSGGGSGTVKITGPNPGRIKPRVIAFAKKVSAIIGETIVGSDGTGHSRLTVDGNVSQHSTGNATDVPATGAHLIRLGQAALIAAGMPRAQAVKQTGGLFNVGPHQIIFNTHIGGNHTNHLHISAR